MSYQQEIVGATCLARTIYFKRPSHHNIFVMTVPLNTNQPINQPDITNQLYTADSDNSENYVPLAKHYCPQLAPRKSFFYTSSTYFSLFCRFSRIYCICKSTVLLFTCDNSVGL